MSLKCKNGFVSVRDVQLDYNMNDRLSPTFEVVEGLKVDTYSLGLMIDQILAKGRIVEPIHINGKTNKVLRGFRRLSAAAKIVANDAYPQDVRDAMLKIPCVTYNDLTDNEELEIIHDKGTSKEIGRAELIRSVWRMVAGGYSPTDIGMHLMHSLAKYTGKTAKLNQLPDDPGERAKRVKSWFIGTLNQYMIAAYNLGPRVQRAVLLTELGNDGLLPKDAQGNPTVTPEFVTKRTRIGELVTAKKQDIDRGQWDAPKFTGPAFEELIAKFIREDTGTATEADQDAEVLSNTKLEEAKNNARSNVAKAAFSRSQGNKVPEFADLDSAAARWEGTSEVLQRHFDNIAVPEIRDFVGKILHMENLADLDRYMVGLCETAESSSETAGSRS
jgi:hypothetical protein